MAMTRYSALLKASALLEPHHQIVSCHVEDTRWGRVLPLCRGAGGVFYSPIYESNKTIQSFAILGAKRKKK